MYNIGARAGPWGRSCCGDLSPFSSHFRGLETVGGDAASQFRNRSGSFGLRQAEPARRKGNEFLAVIHTQIFIRE